MSAALGAGAAPLMACFSQNRRGLVDADEDLAAGLQRGGGHIGSAAPATSEIDPPQIEGNDLMFGTTLGFLSRFAIRFATARAVAKIHVATA